MFYSFVVNTINRFGWINGVLLALGLALLPFFILSAYCQPFADDFWLTNIAIEKGSWQAQQIIRQNWSGRYFAMFLGSINPLVYHSVIGYKILPILLMLFTMGSFYALLSRLGPWIAPKQRLLYTLLFQVLYLGFMPAIASGYYWMSSALNYQTALIVLLLLATLLCSYRKNRRPVIKTGYVFLVSALLFAGIGCNELSLVLLLEATILLVVLDYRHNKRLNRMLAWFVIVALASSLLAISSPGNLVRLQTHANHSNLLYSLAYAFAVTINNTFNYLTSSPILLFTILFIPVSQKLFGNVFSNVKTPHPVITSFVLFLSIFQCFFLIYWNRGTHAPIWTQNFIYFIFLGGWFLNAGLCTHYYQTVQHTSSKRLPAYARLLLIGACFLLIFHNKQSTVRIAYSDWLSGEAAGYNRELKLRYSYLKNNACSICPVKDIVHRPKTIYFRQEPSISSWENALNARYFGKKLIIISE